MKENNTRRHPLKEEEYPFYFKILGLGGFLLLLLIWGLPIYFYQQLPEQIPVHFNLEGKADRYGHKITAFLLPVVGTFTMASIRGAQRLQNTWKGWAVQRYQIQLDPIAEKRMLSVISLLTGCLFVLIEWITVATALHMATPSFFWIIVIAAIMVLYPVLEIVLHKTGLR